MQWTEDKKNLSLNSKEWLKSSHKDYHMISPNGFTLRLWTSWTRVARMNAQEMNEERKRNMFMYKQLEDSSFQVCVN